MFFKSSDIDIERKIIAKNRIPILVKDENWLKLFGSVDDKLINDARRELEAALERQRDAEIQLREKSREKRKIMNKILTLSNELNNNQLTEGVELLEQYQQEIYTLNDEIDNLTFELENLPKEIREANLNLIKATVKLAYKQLADWEKSLEPLGNEIESLRNELKELINKKNDYEEKINMTYKFLHGMLGSKEMEKLDKDMLD